MVPQGVLKTKIPVAQTTVISGWTKRKVRTLEYKLLKSSVKMPQTWTRKMDDAVNTVHRVEREMDNKVTRHCVVCQKMERESRMDSLIDANIIWSV